jgi:hypothetical protein
VQVICQEVSAVRDQRRNQDDSRPRPYRFAPTPESLVEVERVLQRWAVTVYRMPGREVLAEDYFDDFRLAKARAEDFGHLLRSRRVA